MSKPNSRRRTRSKCRFCRAIFVRILFVLHAIWTVYLSTVITSTTEWWYCVVGIVPLTLEAVITLKLHYGHEYMYFCPSIFIYSLCMFPPVWVMELHLGNHNGSLSLTSRQPSVACIPILPHVDPPHWDENFTSAYAYSTVLPNLLFTTQQATESLDLNEPSDYTDLVSTTEHSSSVVTSLATTASEKTTLSTDLLSTAATMPIVTESLTTVASIDYDYTESTMPDPMQPDAAITLTSRDLLSTQTTTTVNVIWDENTSQLSSSWLEKYDNSSRNDTSSGGDLTFNVTEMTTLAAGVNRSTLTDDTSRMSPTTAFYTAALSTNEDTTTTTTTSATSGAQTDFEDLLVTDKRNETQMLQFNVTQSLDSTENSTEFSYEFNSLQSTASQFPNYSEKKLELTTPEMSREVSTELSINNTNTTQLLKEQMTSSLRTTTTVTAQTTESQFVNLTPSWLTEELQQYSNITETMDPEEQAIADEEAGKIRRKRAHTDMNQMDFLRCPPGYVTVTTNFTFLGSVFGQLHGELRTYATFYLQCTVQLLLLLLIVGRWALPKGTLTHYQLSQLLLVYFADAADIAEFFETLNDRTIAMDEILCTVVLSCWSVSILRFSIVTAEKEMRDRRIRRPSVATYFLPIFSSKKRRMPSCCDYISMEVIGIALNMFLQNAPYLGVRLYVIIEYQIINYTNLFFAAKNMISVVLMLYRLIAIFHRISRVKRSEKGYELRSIVVQSLKITGVPIIETTKRKKNSVWISPMNGAGSSANAGTSDGNSDTANVQYTTNCAVNMDQICNEQKENKQVSGLSDNQPGHQCQAELCDNRIAKEMQFQDMVQGAIGYRDEDFSDAENPSDDEEYDS